MVAVLGNRNVFGNRRYDNAAEEGVAAAIEPAIDAHMAAICLSAAIEMLHSGAASVMCRSVPLFGRKARTGSKEQSACHQCGGENSGLQRFEFA